MGHGVGCDKEIHFAHLFRGRWGCEAAEVEKRDSVLLVPKETARCASVLRGLGREIGRRLALPCWQFYLFSYFFVDAAILCSFVFTLEYIPPSCMYLVSLLQQQKRPRPCPLPGA